MPATIECTAVAGDVRLQSSTRGQEQAHPLDTVAQIQRLSRHLVFKPDRALCWHTSREGQGNREDLRWTRHCADKCIDLVLEAGALELHLISAQQTAPIPKLASLRLVHRCALAQPLLRP